jgi:hypothetical protein
VISSLQRLKSISVAPPRPAEPARSVPDAPAVTAPVLKVPSLGTPETSSATRLVIQPRDEALAPGATVEVPHGEPLTVQREESPAPAEPVIEKHPARLARPTLTKPGLARPATEPSPPATPPETEAAKPASLPEERLGPIVRTSPERPSLRATPAAPIDETAAPIASEAEPGPRRLIPASDSPEGVASAEGRPNAERVAASEPAAAAAPIPAEAPHEGPAENASPAIESAMAAEPAPEAAEARERVPEAAAAERPAEAAAPAKRRGPAAPAEAPVRAPIRAQWPSEEEMTSPFVRVARVLIGSVIVAALFTGGWLLGGMAPDRTEQAQKTNPFMQLLQVFSFATGRYHVAITTEPDGASVAVDGKDIARRTPATIDLKPGAHQVTLSYPDLGSATFGVRGARDQDVTLHEALWGRLSVEQDNPDVPVKVSVDGRDLGFVPVTIDSVAPGAHEVRFSGPSMTPWAQTVAVKVRESARIVAHPMVSPATGVLTVRATLNDAQGSTPLNGGEVWLDGELVGRTPLTLELPRGPHSVKVVYGQETGAVQVIDLPGGNQRFAAFQLGSGGPDLRLTPASVVGKVLPDQPALVSAGMDGVNASDVREMWLHVRGPDDNWRRYPLNVMKTPAGVVGVTTFPLGVFDDGGLTKYYLSALLITGDEYFTEIASAHLVSAPSAPAAK